MADPGNGMIEAPIDFAYVTECLVGAAVTSHDEAVAVLMMTGDDGAIQVQLNRHAAWQTALGLLNYLRQDHEAG